MGGGEGKVKTKENEGGMRKVGGSSVAMAKEVGRRGAKQCKIQIDW